MGKAVARSFFAVAVLLALVANGVHAAERMPSQYGVGIYVMNIGDISHREAKFYADFLLYLYDITTPNLLNKDCNNVTELETVTSQITPFLVNAGKGAVVTNYTNYYRVQGEFHYRLNLKDWPFDVQRLEIIVEPDKKSYKDAQLCRLPVFTGISKTVRFPGADPSILHPSWDISCKRYPPLDLASPSKNDLCIDNSYQRFHFFIRIERPSHKAFVKAILPPLFIVIVIMYSYSMPLDDSTTRLTVTGSMLISAVLFHANLLAQVPLHGQLTYADRFMIVVYSVIIVSFLLAMMILKFFRAGNKNFATLLASYSEFAGWICVPLSFTILERVSVIEFLAIMFLGILLSIGLRYMLERNGFIHRLKNIGSRYRHLHEHVEVLPKSASAASISTSNDSEDSEIEIGDQPASTELRTFSAGINSSAVNRGGSRPPRSRIADRVESDG